MLCTKASAAVRQALARRDVKRSLKRMLGLHLSHVASFMIGTVTQAGFIPRLLSFIPPVLPPIRGEARRVPPKPAYGCLRGAKVKMRSGSQKPSGYTAPTKGELKKDIEKQLQKHALICTPGGNVENQPKLLNSRGLIFWKRP